MLKKVVGSVSTLFVRDGWCRGQWVCCEIRLGFEMHSLS